MKREESPKKIKPRKSGKANVKKKRERKRTEESKDDLKRHRSLTGD